MLISEDYRRLNAQKHLESQDYGALAGHIGPSLISMCANNGFKSILDYGCGKGTLSRVLEGSQLTVAEYDPGIPGKDGEPEPADLVVCIDVMEHVEPEYIDNVLMHIASLSKVAAYFIIDNGPAKAVLSDGRNAHLTVESVEWWKERLLAHFNLGVCDHVDGFESLDKLYYRFKYGGTLAFGVPKK